MTYGASKYKETSIATATSEQLLLMYYEAAIRHVKRAVHCLEKNDPAGKGKAIGKAHDIINELANNLDFEKGGDIARELERLYNYMVEQLVRSNAANDVNALQDVQKILETLLSAWRVAVKEVLDTKKKSQE